MTTWAKRLDEFKIFPRLGAAVFMVLTVHVVNSIVDMAQTAMAQGGTGGLSDISFAAVCGLVAVVSGAAVKTLDYLGKQENGHKAQ